MTDAISACITVKRKTELIGEHDIRKMTFHKEGLCVVEQYSSGVADEFTVPPIAYSFEFQRDLFSGICRSATGDITDIISAYSADIRYSDGIEMHGFIRSDSESLHVIDSSFIGLIDFEDDKCSRRRNSCYTATELDRLFDDRKITEDIYRANRSLVDATEKRRSHVETAIQNATYPFEVTFQELIDDMREGLITAEQYNMFVWFFRLRRGYGDRDRSSEFISLKLRFSVWGQRLLGKYDTYEFLLDREDSEIVDRRYSVHGTLFEGCGNYKAPDDAEHISLDTYRTHLIFRYLGILLDNGILGVDHSEAKYDCAFFDLYTRMDNLPSLHTKGTSEYPYFIKLLMFLMDRDLKSIY